MRFAALNVYLASTYVMSDTTPPNQIYEIWYLAIIGFYLPIPVSIISNLIFLLSCATPQIMCLTDDLLYKSALP